MESTTACPRCAGRIFQPEARACPYCGHELGGAGIADESPHGSRLSKMGEHEQFPAAAAVDPAGHELEAARRDCGWGTAWALVGVAVAVAAAVSDSSWLWVAVGVVVAFRGARRFLRGRRVRAALEAHPLQKRPAIVTDRRSETVFNGWSGRVTYFFKLEFEDGVEGEFRFPGRGWPHDPLARGATGLAYTRGANLVDFKHIKV